MSARAEISHLAALFLRPGQWWFGSAQDRIRSVSTVLGSCIAITLWHPQLRLGGMCHFLLPRREGARAQFDARYGEEAIQLLIAAVKEVGTSPEQYEIGVFGGANMFAGDPSVTVDIGALNARFALDALRNRELSPSRVELLGSAHRHISLYVVDGSVAVRTGPAYHA